MTRTHASLENARDLLLRHGLAPKRQFGQNFLLDRNLAERIAELAVPESAFVVEIGAGLGALTEPLLRRARSVVAIERDRELVPILRERFEPDVACGRLAIVEADAKRFDYAAAFRAVEPPRALAGNLPYHLTGPLLERIADLSATLERATVLVQLEVADRLVARPATRAYGALSVFTQAAYAVTRAFVIRRGAFLPAPGVDSALVVLSPHERRLAEETSTFRQLVKAAFAQRRKTLRNAWSSIAEPLVLAATAAEADIDLAARGETLSVSEFGRMAQALAIETARRGS